jgi:hypothetical protein
MREVDGLVVGREIGRRSQKKLGSGVVREKKNQKGGPGKKKHKLLQKK